MQPFRFGPPARQLYGVYHAALGDATRASAVLLLNPYGQEAVRTQRMYRVLADRLARKGHHVLRFDYYGTGDAAGSDEEGDLEGWAQDVLAAQHELLRRSKCTRTLWLGARLGASLAVLASRSASPPPRGLVLWEPVLSGEQYLRELASSHVRALSESYSIVPPHLRDRSFPDEALGFAIGASLPQQLRQLDLPRQGAHLRDLPVALIDRPRATGASEYARSLAAQGQQATHIPLEHDFDWTSEEALNTALVPHEAVHLLATQVECLP